jgi:hypothetical protein
MIAGCFMAVTVSWVGAAADAWRGSGLAVRQARVRMSAARGAVARDGAALAPQLMPRADFIRS